MNSSKRKLICVTPVKNENWILERFLKCASLWADHIVIADQQSTDGSREIATRFSKVRLIDNNSSKYDEGGRQRLLLNAARDFDRSAVILALDADELLSANFATSPEFQTALTAEPGTVLMFNAVNLAPVPEKSWLATLHGPYGFVDDGAEHEGQLIHSYRVPTPANAPSLIMRDVRILHYQFCDWARMKSKHRWYECWERLNTPRRRALKVYRIYHHMEAVSTAEFINPAADWVAAYQDAGIDISSIRPSAYYWWDDAVLDWLLEHGTKFFAKCDIWDFDWNAYHRMRCNADAPRDLSDPRSRTDRAVHMWLRETQARPRNLKMRAAESGLRILGW